MIPGIDVSRRVYVRLIRRVGTGRPLIVVEMDNLKRWAGNTGVGTNALCAGQRRKQSAQC